MTRYQLSLAENGFCSGANDGYFGTYEQNLFENKMRQEYLLMFQNGSGNELKDSATKKAKAAAVHSSSMLAYNMFHWIGKGAPVAIRVPRQRQATVYSRVLFEVKIPCLRGFVKPNMDVVLISQDGTEALFVESKFTEHLSARGFDLSESYRQSENYYPGIKSKAFVTLITDVECWINKKVGGYKEGIKQEICHLLAMNNLTKSIEAQRLFQAECNRYDRRANYFRDVGEKYFDTEKIRKFRFVNLIFDPKDSDRVASLNFESYFLFYREFIRLAREAKLFPHGLTVCSQPMTYSDFWKQTNDQMPNALKEYLHERYIQYSGMRYS